MVVALAKSSGAKNGGELVKALVEAGVKPAVPIPWTR
jgi:hypothetical protein